MAEHFSGVRFAAVARQLLDEPGEKPTMDKAVATAVELIGGCDHAALTILRGRMIETPAATSDVARRGDRLQYELNEGPCIDSLRKEQTTLSADLAQDPRWTTWGPRVVTDLGIHSMLCFQLFTDSESIGALNLYAEKVNAFDDYDQALGLTLAAQIAVALSSTRKVDQQARGIVTSAVIGQAQGMMMERYGLGPQAAFELLKRMSKDSAIKVAELAHEVVSTRELPE